MKPLFKEEMDFLGIDPKFENYLWVDSRCYYAFDKKYNKIKFGRDIKKLPTNSNNLLTHDEYCKYHYITYTKYKVQKERNKFKEYLSSTNYDEAIILVSGGKDSTVMEHLIYDISQEYLKTRWLFSNTSNETHHTYQYVKNTYGEKLEICNPKKGFYIYCKDFLFIPSQLNRACCNDFKEWVSLQYLKNDVNKKLLHICGIRTSESRTRSTYEQIRKARWKNKKAQNNWMMYLPIINFDDLDIWSYIFYYNLNFNNLYRFGYNRVGCTNCPYRSDYELQLNKHFLPTYYKHWQDTLKYVFINGGLSINMNCTLEEFLNGCWRGGAKRETPTDEVVDEFCKFKNINKTEAMKYFNTTKCKNCGHRLSKDMIALNMKYFGRDTLSRLCLTCLAKEFNTTKKVLKEQIKNFKQQGCKLF